MACALPTIKNRNDFLVIANKGRLSPQEGLILQALDTLDKSKQLMGQQQFDEKLEQNEDLAQLRADTSIEKQQMANQVKVYSDRMKRKDVKTLKGPRR